MVAGVYLVARLFSVYVFAAPEILTVIAYTGAFTALFAAVIAIAQTDIKRVLAFSTISQIAYMMVALGVSGFGGEAGLGYMASLFHLFTHAFFKALLFLGAGAVIHAVHSNEMSEMGGLRKYMPVTHITFLIACLAISGIPPFSGFFSKDEILAAAFHHDMLLFATLWLVAGLTAFYMFRLYYNIFWGERSKDAHEAHEAPKSMSVPLIILAVFTCFTGLVPFSQYISNDSMPFAAHLNWGIAASGIAVSLIGILAATVLYAKNSDKAARIAASLGGLYKATLYKFYLDEVWMFFAQKIMFYCVAKPAAWFDKTMVDGALNEIAGSANKLAWSIRGLQSGKIQFYAWVFLVGTFAITIWALFI